MASKTTKYAALLVAVIGSLSFFVVPSFPADEIFLTGIVKTIEPDSRFVMVDVRSAACRGMMKFTVDDPSDLADFIGKRIEFTIESQRCENGQIYKMVRGEGTR